MSRYTCTDDRILKGTGTPIPPGPAALHLGLDPTGRVLTPGLIGPLDFSSCLLEAQLPQLELFWTLQVLDVIYLCRQYKCWTSVIY